MFCFLLEIIYALQCKQLISYNAWLLLGMVHVFVLRWYWWFFLLPFLFFSLKRLFIHNQHKDNNIYKHSQNIHTYKSSCGGTHNIHVSISSLATAYYNIMKWVWVLLLFPFKTLIYSIQSHFLRWFFTSFSPLHVAMDFSIFGTELMAFEIILFHCGICP